MIKRSIVMCLILALLASCFVGVSAQNITPVTQEMAGQLERANGDISFDDLLGKVKVKSIVFAPITIKEKTEGQWVEDAAGKYYHYNWQQAIYYRVTFSNGYSEIFSGPQFTYKEKVYTLTFTDPQSFQTPWVAGNTYPVSISVAGVTGTMQITIAPREDLPGDCNGDGEVTNEDVIYLLWYTLFPENYTLETDGDFTKDGQITNEDVIYLLWHTLFPETYPL